MKLRSKKIQNTSIGNFFYWSGALSCICCLTTSCVNTETKTAVGVFSTPAKEESGRDNVIDLDEIQQTGELIVLTLYGPTTYFEFKGENFGSQYLLADAFAQSIGVSVRIEVCRSVNELKQRLSDGDGDLVAVGMDAPSAEGPYTRCGIQSVTWLSDTLASAMNDKSIKPKAEIGWLVRRSSTQLAETLNAWFKDHRTNLFSMSFPKLSIGGRTTFTPHRHPHSPMLDASRGIISHFDPLFKRYSQNCLWDWRLLAAQAYQESGFDTNAVSWMGAMGLMQLMPATARDMGVREHEIMEAEPNVRGAVRLINQLDRHFSNVRDANERINFILAAYNAGAGHIEDARTLAQIHGKNPNIWTGHVESIVLHMSEPRFYNNPAVRHGYFRGIETYNYVRDIRGRWNKYKLTIH